MIDQQAEPLDRARPTTASPEAPESGPAEDVTLEDVTLDAFFGGRFFAYQPRRGPRASIDALFLAAAVPMGRGKPERYLEAGAGSGVVSLALATRQPDCEITAVEREAPLFSLLCQNIAKNAMSSRVIPIDLDITAASAQVAKKGLEPGGYEHVLANPPYFNRGSVRVPPQATRARAHSASPGALTGWVRFLTAMCAPKGSLTLIFRPEGLPDLLAALEGRFGAISVFPLFPHVGEPARRILVQGRKGSRTPLQLMPGIVLHNADGSYTDDAEAVLRRGQPLDITQTTGRRG